MQLRLFAVRCSVRRLSKAFALWVMEVRVSTFLGVACFHERITWADRLNIPVLLTTSVALRVRTEDLPMRARIRERPSRRPVSRDPWSLQPISRIICQRPSDFIRRQAWTAPATTFSNGISAVTSLCLVDEAGARGPPLLIAGDEHGGISIQRIPTTPPGGDNGKACRWSSTPGLRRARLHDSCVNTIKLLPDARGFVCASDDGVLSAVATLEAGSESDLRRATFALHGHSGYITDCDTAASGHAVVSSSTDGRMLLWDPLAGNKPVSTVNIGRPVNSACFSAGDNYALLCAPERSGMIEGGTGASVGGNGSDELVQIWDLRSLKCFRDSIPHALAEAFGEPKPDPSPDSIHNMQPPQSPSPSAFPPASFLSTLGHDDSAAPGARTASVKLARAKPKLPSWLTPAGGSPSAILSPPTPLLRRSAWADDNTSDTESLSSGSTWLGGRGCGSDSGKDSAEKENNRQSPGSTVRANGGGRDWATTPTPSTKSRSTTPSSSESCGHASIKHASLECSTGVRILRDRPAAVLCRASIPVDSNWCLDHGPEGRSWVPGGSMTWQPGKRRARDAARRRAAATQDNQEAVGDLTTFTSQSRACGACRGGGRGVASGGASVYSVQVTSDGRGILTASRDATVTLWDAQSRQVVYRFGHSRLSMRARPILSGVASSGGGESPRCGHGEGRIGGASSGGEVFTGMTDGEVRAWRLRSRFPNRVFKPTRKHEGYEVTCIASSRDGTMFASADSSGKVCVQSATTGGFSLERRKDSEF